MLAELAPDDRLIPSQPGQIYAVDEPTYTMLAIAGHDNGPSINIHPEFARPGQYRLALYTHKVNYTLIAGHPTVVRSVAETMLRGAARQAGIEVKP